MLKMKDELKNIDNYYKSSLENYKEEADAEVWESMKWTLFWMRYKWRIGIGSVILLLGLGFWISGGVFDTSESQTIVNTNDTYKSEARLTSNNNAKEISNINDKSISEVQNEAINHEGQTDDVEVFEFDPNQVIIDVQSENVAPVSVVSKNASTTTYNDKLSLSGMIRKETIHSIALLPDSGLIGYNRRTDLQSPGYGKQRYSVNIAVGPAFSQYDISGDDSEYLALRNLNESSKPGWSLGVDLRLHLKNWIISSGLTYSVYNQARAYKHSYEEYSPEDSYYDYDTTWAWFFDPPEIGVPIVTNIDSSWVDVYKNMVIDNSGTNQVKYFEIPLLIGYRYNTNMFALEINTGFSAGFLVYSDIKVPDFTNNIEIVVAEQMNQTMFNFVVNASFYYHVDGRTSLFLSPYFKQNMVSVFGDDYPVNQRSKTYGLNLGINFRF